MNNPSIWQPLCDKKITSDLDILYCRLSRDDGDGEESNSISNQKTILAEYAAEKGFDHPVFVVDDGYTGTNFQRPGWQAVHDQIEQGNVRSIICKNKDRFGRDYLRVGLYMEMFKERGIRFIAIGDGVDNIREDDLAPFRDLIAEQYAKDASKKIIAVLHSKGHSGKPLTTKAIYGYINDPEDRNHWLIDEEAAQIVRRIFRMTLDGKGPFIIARALTDEKIIRPSCHIARLTGTVTEKTEETPYQWTGTTIKSIISKPEYTGCVVNFRTYKTSFKTKKHKLNPPEKWEIFEGKHEAIIDKETWVTAQKCRKVKRRRNSLGETNPLTGLVHCADCGSRMYNHRGSNYTEKRPSQDSYCCPRYNKYPSECTMHYISTKNLRELVLNTIRRVSGYVREYEAEFLEKLRETAEIKQSEEAKAQKKQLAADKRRVAELDRLIEQIYEDKVSGTLTEKRFITLSAKYEAEQETLEARIIETEKGLAEYAEDTCRADKFIAIVRKHTDFEELTPAMLNEYIDRIVVHEAERPRGQRNQRVDIFLSFIGQFTPPGGDDEETETISPEERRKAQRREHYYANRERILAKKAEERAAEKAARLAAAPVKTPEEIAAEEAARKAKRQAYQREYQREWQRRKREEAAAKKKTA